jgi:hypothetical protein
MGPAERSSAEFKPPANCWRLFAFVPDVGADASSAPRRAATRESWRVDPSVFLGAMGSVIARCARNPGHFGSAQGRLMRPGLHTLSTASPPVCVGTDPLVRPAGPFAANTKTVVRTAAGRDLLALWHAEFNVARQRSLGSYDLNLPCSCVGGNRGLDFGR